MCQWRSRARLPLTVLGPVKRTVPRHRMERCQLLRLPRSPLSSAWGPNTKCVSAHTCVVDRSLSLSLNGKFSPCFFFASCKKKSQCWPFVSNGSTIVSVCGLFSSCTCELSPTVLTNIHIWPVRLLCCSAKCQPPFGGALNASLRVIIHCTSYVV